MTYPREIFCANEDVTRENKRAYDARLAKIVAKCEEINPDYYKLGLRERREIRLQAEKEVN